MASGGHTVAMTMAHAMQFTRRPICELTKLDAVRWPTLLSKRIFARCHNHDDERKSDQPAEHPAHRSKSHCQSGIAACIRRLPDRFDNADTREHGQNARLTARPTGTKDLPRHPRVPPDMRARDSRC